MSKRKNRKRDQEKRAENQGALPGVKADPASPATAAPGADADGGDDEPEISMTTEAVPAAPASDEKSGAATPASTAESAPAPAEAAAAGPATSAGGDAAASDGPAPAAKGDAPAAVIPFPAEPPAATRTVAITPELEPVVERLKAGRCVLWAGSGLEELAGAPGYRRILERLLDQVPAGPDAEEARRLLPRRPLTVAGFIRRRLGDGFGAALREVAAAPAELPEPLTLLADLPFRAVVTTGLSDMLERAFVRDGTAPSVYTPGDARSIRRDGRSLYLLKALGDPTRDGTVVFSAQGLNAALLDGTLGHAVQDLFRNRTVLFLGVDALLDLDLIFTRLLPGPPAHGGHHYAVLPGLSAIERDELEAAYGVKVLDEGDTFGVVRVLREAVGDAKDVLPDDDDMEGWLALLSDEPDRADARERLITIEARLKEKGDHERLLELHLGLVEVEQGHTGRGRRLREVADIFEQHFGDLAKAFTALLAAYKEDPSADGGHEVADRLERLAEATNSWAELLSEYAALGPALPEAMRIEHWMRLARLYGEKLNHAQYALQSLDEALKLDPGNRVAQEQRVVLLRRTEHWKELADALGGLAEKEESLGRRSELYLEQGDIFESRLHDGPAAAKAYRAALDADPGSTDALNALEQLYRRRGEHKDLVAILDEKAKVGDGEQSLQIRREAAGLVAEKLADRRGAIERYEALRNDGVCDVELLRALEGLYEAEGQTEEYLQVLDAQADAIKDDKEKVSLYRRLAAEWEDRPDGTARAAEYLEKLLALDPKAEESLRAVERLYAAEKKWEALVDAYRRRLELPGADRVALQAAIAQTFENEIKDVHRAIDAWNQVLPLAPTHDGALEALGRLYEATESWEKALEVLDKRVEGTRAPELKVQILYRTGRLAADRLGDTKQAEERYHRALEVDPTHVPSMTATVELYRKSGEFLRAAKLLIEAEGHTANRLEKTRMLVEAGEIYDSLEQHTTAIDLYLKAMAVDPEHVEAGNRVSELLWTAERWAELVPILEMLSRKEADKATQKTRWLRLAKAASALGQNDKAAKAYSKVAELDPTDLDAQLARGKLLFAEEKFSDAREAFKAVLAHHGDALKDPERVDLYFHLGECNRKLGEIDKAKNFYAKALEIDATHRPTILARIDVEGDDPKKIIEAKRALFATASDEEKVKLLTEIGDLAIDKLEAPPDALAAYEEALAIRPEARSLLHKCLDLHVEQKSWQKALDVLARLTDLETIPAIRAKMKFTRAVVWLEELDNKEEATKLFAEALDDDAAATKAAERLEELLVQTENWKELTRYYRKAIKRLPADADSDTPELRKERLRLWSAMADTLLEKLQEIQSAIAALEVAATFDRGNPKRAEQLAELYLLAGPDYLEKAITSQQQLLRGQHDRIASYRALRKLYDEAKQPEKALSVAYALAFLKKGDAEDANLVSEAKKRPLQVIRKTLDDEIWTRNLVHPDEDRFVGALFAQLLPTLSKAHSQPYKDVPLNRKDKVESTDPRPFAKVLRYISSVLNVTLPYECYVKYDLRDPVAIANCLDAKNVAVPCLVVGAPMLGDKRSERELIFELTKRLSYFRADRYLRFVLPQAAQLGMMIDAAISLGAEADREAPATGEVGRIGQDLKRALPPKSLEQVVFIGRKLKGQKGDALANAWLAATELTATRAAFLILADLETTARFVAAEPATISSHPTLHRLKELIHFSITEECFALRKHLGML